jgi:hypothetical protein
LVKRIITERRPGLIPALGVSFEVTLGALLKTPPPPAGDKSTRKAVPKGKRKRSRNPIRARK